MDLSKDLIGEVELLYNPAIPKDGLAKPKQRVELYEELTPKSAWIAELIILDNLPWYAGEKRKVKVRIMSDEFKTHVEENRPNLMVRYGSSVIGKLEFV